MKNKKELQQRLNLSTPIYNQLSSPCLDLSQGPLTSDDAEELLDPHAGVDPAKELLHVMAPTLQDGTARLTHCPLSTAASCAAGHPTYIHLAGKDSTHPAQHLIQPLLKMGREKSAKIKTCSLSNGFCFL